MVQQVQQQFSHLMQKGAFNPIRRYLTGADADDRLQEGISQTFELALRKAAKGEHMDDALVVFAARLRATDIRRQFVKGGQPRRDALHRANFTDGRTQVFHLDGFDEEIDDWYGEGDVGLQAAWLPATAADPAEQLAAAIDLDTWLSSLGDADRELLAGRLAGHTLQELSWRTDASISSTFKHLRELGKELAQHAGILLVNMSCKPRGRSVAASC
jgi:hypothetical protein